MKTKKLNFEFDGLSETHVFVVMARYWNMEWKVLFVDHDKQSAIDTVRRFESNRLLDCVEYKILETELF